MGGEEIRALGQRLGVGIDRLDIGRALHPERREEKHVGNRNIDLAYYVIPYILRAGHNC